MDKTGQKTRKECEFTFLSLNAHGLNDKLKLVKLFHWVKSMNIDIVLFQETYSSKTSENKWQND